ncbi:MAG: DUF4062 domain-containing protein [Proteobacteria bacterium]|nr:DUF4062 domain-containing protein [Pseudomonadota bacterium]
MAKPRIFISSTYYDLKYVREELDRFTRELGYEPIRHEAGHIPYGSQDAPEKYAYREVESCDILVCIVGGRFGTESRDGARSITQTELKHALDKGIQVFIMIDYAVQTEYQTYLINKDNVSTKYRHADDRRVFEFIEHVYSLPNNNPIFTFSTSKDILSFLKEQWAGLFQRFLSDKRRTEEVRVLNEMKTIAATLQQLVTYLSSESKDKDEIIKNILLINHPAFRRFASLTGTNYRVFFQTRAELDTWLAAKGYRQVTSDSFDDGSLAEWYRSQKNEYVRMTHELFDEDGRLKPFSEEQWDDNWLTIHKTPETPSAQPDDDIPF